MSVRLARGGLAGVLGDRDALLIVIALFLLPQAGLQLLFQVTGAPAEVLGSFPGGPGLSLSVFLAAWVPTGLLAIVLARRRGILPREIGFRRPSMRGLAQSLALLAPLLGLDALYVALLERAGFGGARQVVARLIEGQGAGSGVQLMTLCCVLVLLGPLVEEWLFRGLLFQWAERAWGAGGAIVGAALLFGLIHAGDPVSVIPAVLLGLACGLARRWSGSILGALLVHAINNALALALALA